MGDKITHITITDIETTGLCGPNTTDDQIIEVATLKVRLADRAIVGWFSTLIKPHGTDQTVAGFFGHDPAPLAWDLGQYHLDGGHFTFVDQAEWDRAMTLEAALTRLAFEFFPGATFCGNNVPFDVRHYQRDFAALNMPWPKTDYHVVDLTSPAIFLAMTGQIPGVSLRHSAKWAGRGPQKHRALEDCLDVYAVFWAMFDFYTMGMHPGDSHGPYFVLGEGVSPFPGFKPEPLTMTSPTLTLTQPTTVGVVADLVLGDLPVVRQPRDPADHLSPDRDEAPAHDCGHASCHHKHGPIH
jgi:hypothetical protein